MRSLADVPLRDRLLARRVVDDNGCWLWTGSSPRYGYLWIDGKMKLVHRLMATLELGIDYNDPIKVLHRCDVTICFNPEHLFLGTQKDNVRDAIEKRRFVFNVPTPTYKLSDEDQSLVASEYQSGMTMREIGALHGVTAATVYKSLVRCNVPTRRRGPR